MDDRPQDEGSAEVIQQPQPAHVREEEYESDSEIEATELRPVIHIERNAKPLPRLSRVITPEKPLIHWYDPFKKFWRHQIRISVPHVDCRDHLANERTFLGYLRTSVALSMLGCVLEQLWSLQHREHPSQVFGFFVSSKPLAGIFQVAALMIVLLGGIRFWRQQSAMAIGKVHAGGWEVVTIAVLSFLLLLGLFVVHLGIDVYKDELNTLP